MKFILAVGMLFSNMAFANTNFICHGSPDNFVITVSKDYVTAQVSGDKDLNDALKILGFNLPTEFVRAANFCYASQGLCSSILFDEAKNNLLFQIVKPDYTTLVFNKVYSCKAL